MPHARLAAALLLSLAALPAAAAVDRTAVERLRSDASGPVAISRSPATGAVRFVRPLAGGTLPQPGAKAAAPEARAKAFLESYGGAFGIRSVDAELRLARRQQEDGGATHLSYAQVYRGLPVFAGVLRVHLDRDGAITAANGTFVPDLALDPRPTVDAAAAAVTATRDGGVVVDAAPRLLVFREGLAAGVPGANHLAWEITVARAGERAHVYVDAHSGKPIDRILLSTTAMKREAYNGGLTAAQLVWSEGQALPYSGSGTAETDTGINKLIGHAEEAYRFFQAIGARDGFDDHGATMKTVWNAPDIECPNANWDGRSTNFCALMDGDDVVTHEWTHAVTQYTHGLVYQWQPGALNEAYSDIFGETIDQLDGTGLDQPSIARTAGSCSQFDRGGKDASYRWLLGEDSNASGTIRDMWNPNCHFDPGHTLDRYYACTRTDDGGVHTNSGVPNHAYALLVDGGTYNGVTVPAIGMTRAAHVYYRAMTVYQVPVTDFADHADALEQSCRDLASAGTNLRSLVDGSPSGEVVRTSDCDAVHAATVAVQLRSKPSCSFPPLLAKPAPQRCASGAGQVTWSEGFEGGFGAWQRSNEGVYADYDARDWTLDSSLPERAGTAAFAIDSVRIGDCRPGSDDQSGAMHLVSPPITAPASGDTRVAFQHYVATEDGYDGGNVAVSVDGGAFQRLGADRFVFNAYNKSLETANNTNPMKGQAAWTGTDDGTIDGSWGESQINLTGLVRPGGSFRLRFDFGVDGCNGVDGWYVDDVQVYSCGNQPPAACTAGPDTLCLLGGRYKVEVDWHNQFDGSSGRGKAIPSTDLSGLFAFTDPRNVELMVKALDFGDVVKVFYGQLTNLQFTMHVTDTRTGAVKTYSNTPGECGGLDNEAFPKVATAKAACTPGANTLCLLGKRFKVEVDWHNQFNGASGRGGAHTLTGSDLSGLWSFDDARNTELLTKALDFGDRILFLYGTLSNLGYTIRVTDTGTGIVKTYENAPGNYCGGIDEHAF